MDRTRTTARMRVSLVTLILATIALVPFVVSQSSAGPQPHCTDIGTSARDIMSGGKGRQVICAKGGSDYVHGRQGKDELVGDGKNDTLIGGSGQDLLKGKKGKDQLFAVDGKPGDTLKGGGGFDHCYIDPGDGVQSCERVFRGGTVQTAESLSNEFGGVIVLAEEQIAEGSPSPVPGPTVTETQTQTITITDCPPGPPDPDPFCGGTIGP